MKLLFHFALGTLINALALYLGSRYIAGFELATALPLILPIAVILTVLNSVLKPILKLVLAPLIVVTLGFGLLLVNMFILFVLDILFQNLTIVGIPALFLGSLLIGFINFIFHSVSKS